MELEWNLNEKEQSQMANLNRGWKTKSGSLDVFLNVVDAVAQRRHNDGEKVPVCSTNHPGSHERNQGGVVIDHKS